MQLKKKNLKKNQKQAKKNIKKGLVCVLKNKEQVWQKGICHDTSTCKSLASEFLGDC